MRLIICKLTSDSAEKPYIFKVPENARHIGVGETLIASTKTHKKVNIISISDEFVIADDNVNALRFFCDPVNISTIIGTYTYDEDVWTDEKH